MTCNGHLEVLSAFCPLTSDIAPQKVVPIPSGQRILVAVQGGSLKKTIMLWVLYDIA